MEDKVKIYALIDPITLKVRYIGRTIRSLPMRLSQHIHRAKDINRSKTHRDNWILSLLKINSKPIIRLLCEVEGWKESHIFEQNLIKKYAHRLTNHDDRGEGGKNRNTTEEQKIKISNTLKEYYKDKPMAFERTVYVYNYDGTFYKEYTSGAKAARDLNIPYSTIRKHLSKIVQDFDSPTKDGRKRKKRLTLFQFSFTRVDKMHDLSK